MASRKVYIMLTLEMFLIPSEMTNKIIDRGLHVPREDQLNVFLLAFEFLV